METEVFLDTSYVIALASSRDAHHQKAVELAQQIEQEQTHLLTTRGVFLEVGNALARARYRLAAIELLGALERDPKVEIAAATDDLCIRAFELFRTRKDKEWGLTDCLSFVFMEDRGLSWLDRTTLDEHLAELARPSPAPPGGRR